MNLTEKSYKSLSLTDFPLDIQKLLTNRAIKNCSSITTEIKVFVMQTVKKINARNK